MKATRLVVTALRARCSVEYVAEDRWFYDELAARSRPERFGGVTGYPVRFDASSPAAGAEEQREDEETAAADERW